MDEWDAVAPSTSSNSCWDSAEYPFSFRGLLPDRTNDFSALSYPTHHTATTSYSAENQLANCSKVRFNFKTNSLEACFPDVSNPQSTQYAESASHYADQLENDECSYQNQLASSSKVGKPLTGSEWIPARVTSSMRFSVHDSLLQALSYMKGIVRGQEILLQIWLPVNTSGKNVLSTFNQPYLISTSSDRLMGYRNASSAFMFLAEEDSKEVIGFPGRTFLDKLPEWTPDVQLFKKNEYPLKDLAYRYNIKGSFSLPIFEKGTRTCIGVLDAVMTSRKISYHRDVQELCKALEVVDLNSSQDFCPPGEELLNGLYLAAIPEISEILRSVCAAYKLPLALTWSPCCRQGKRGCSMFMDKFSSCIATVSPACVVGDGSCSGFNVAAYERYVFYGQGIVGRAFSTEKQCFTADVSCLSKTEYSLSHHAAIFDLHAALAVPLRSIHSRSVEFVLELFFPKDCRDELVQLQMCELLSVILQQSFRTFQVVTDRETFEEPNDKATDFPPPLVGHNSLVFGTIDPKKKGKCCTISLERADEKPKDVFRLTDYNSFSCDTQIYKESCPTFDASQYDIGIEGDDSSYLNRSQGQSSGLKKSKTEKFVSLEVLRQYFAGSLKDAAKGIGVCPTTLKRICRQHGITRWPSRKIKKVGHSLMKLQQVIDSVQGAGGGIQVGSFYNAFPELDSSLANKQQSLSSLKINDPSNPSYEAEFSVTNSRHARSSGDSDIWRSTELVEDRGGLRGGNNEFPEDDDDGGAVINRRCGKTARCKQDEVEGTKNERVADCEDSGGGVRVKAKFEGENVRLRLRAEWGFRRLEEELAQRFGFEECGRMGLKYVDDEGEWVRLASDADLDECRFFHRQANPNAIRISVHRIS